jgi:transcriptional regulator with XRE-family HTH domain
VKLSDWLKQEGLTQEAFGKLLGSDQGHVSDLVRGKVRPRLESVAKIEHVTKGQVTAQDWLDAHRPKRVRVEKLKKAVGKAAR